MSSWLSSLPHQIPFRAASSAVITGESGIEGTMLVTAADALSTGVEIPQTFVFEAMAQLAGTLAFGQSGMHGYLSAIEKATLDGPLSAGDVLFLRMKLEADFGGLFKFDGVALLNGLEFARAKLYLAQSP